MDWAGAGIMTWILIAAGALFLIVGGIGILRLPDFYSRIHPAGITDTMGALLVLVGLMFASGSILVSFKLFFLLLFIAVTSPLATHALAKAAFMRGLRPMLGHELAQEAEDD
ncbi:MAG TPA: monovalent cation/H(+) antiporter subunit G [Chondromyces sp.]|nr:monovalent cation/H(+) antiporter subunit G [Chondromyces sp.]